MSSAPGTHVIQVTNVAPATTLEQMKIFFGYCGKIKNIKLYPSENCIIEPQSRVCYVEYLENWSVGVAQHLTNTVFIDRALIVVPIADDGIPSESTALALTNPSSALPGLMSSGPNALINEITGVDGNLVITTTDPKLTALGLPQYPPLPASYDPAKIEEIRRTLIIGNLDFSVTAESLLKFMNQVGEVKYLSMAGNGLQTTRYAFVEFTDQSSIPKVLQYNGVTFEGKPLLINHSTCAIVKPSPKSSEAAQKEIEEAMKRVREAQSLISAVVEPELPERRRRSHRSQSRSPSRRRSTSRSRRKRSESRSMRSRSPSKSSRSHVKRSHSPPISSRSHSPSRSSRTHSKTSSRDKRSRSRQRLNEPCLSKSPSKHLERKSRSRSRNRKKYSPETRKRRSQSRDKSKRNHRSRSSSPLKSSFKSKSQKSKGYKERDESCERERPLKDEKYNKRSSTKDALKIEKYSHKDNHEPRRYRSRSPSVPQVPSSKKESKSSVIPKKYASSRSHSRSPLSSKRDKYRRTHSRSNSKESSSSFKNKSRSVSKHRSRSRSRNHKRSRSRSKGSIRRTISPARKSDIRRHSRSITPSRKRGSFSPGRHSISRQSMSYKLHSMSSRKRSLTPKRKSVTPRRYSCTPDKRSRSPVYRSRSRSYQSPSPLRLRSSPKKFSKTAKSPQRFIEKSISCSPVNNRLDAVPEESDSVLGNISSLSDNQGANIDIRANNYSEERGYSIPTVIHQNINEHSSYVPSNIDNNYYTYACVDMDLGSD